MIEFKIGDEVVPVKELEVIVDEGTPYDEPPFSGAWQADQTLTLNVYYYQLMWLARMIEPQNRKKAKRIRRLAEPHNPLRLLGL